MLGRDKKTIEDQKKPMAKIERESGDAAISLIAPGMKIVGDCETDGTIRVEGRIEGTIRAGKSVVVGRSGEVIGDIVTQDAVISGKVSGNIAADSRLELQSTCDIQGELRSRRVQLDEGARFNGQVHMEEAGSRTVKPAAGPAPAAVKGTPESQPAVGGN
jgi:cytoskeletal protein CcmA (bactofilin family)